MADREAMRTLIEEAYAARGRGDINGLMSAFHADGMFELKGEKRTFELAGAIKGHANVREAMTGFAAAFEFADREVIGMIIEGENVCVHSRLRIRYVPKNESFATEVVDLFKFKDGKIAELVEFADTALVKQITS
jgi:ketosteroid isomerase-like protein